MIKIILNKLFWKRNVIVDENTKENNGLIEDEVSSNKNSGYRNEVKEKYDFDLPASDTDKILLGNNFENAGDIEKACACYEGCVKNRFKGNGPYDRLIILYKNLDRPDDILRIVKKAISIFEKVTKQGRSDGAKKLEKYKSQLERITGD